MTTGIDTALTEITDALAAVGPEYQGLLEFKQFNLRPDTAREVTEAITDYARRLGLMAAVRDALTALVNDGYPALAVRAIAESAFEELQTDAANIEAALKKFSSNQASALAITSGDPVPKT